MMTVAFFVFSQILLVKLSLLFLLILHDDIAEIGNIISNFTESQNRRALVKSFQKFMAQTPQRLQRRKERHSNSGACTQLDSVCQVPET